MSVERLSNRKLLDAYEKIIEEQAYEYDGDERLLRRIQKQRASIERELYMRLGHWLKDDGPSLVFTTSHDPL